MTLGSTPKPEIEPPAPPHIDIPEPEIPPPQPTVPEEPTPIRG